MPGEATPLVAPEALQEREGIGDGSGIEPAALMPDLCGGHGADQKMKRGIRTREQREPFVCVERLDSEFELDDRLGRVVGGSGWNRDADKIIRGENDGLRVGSSEPGKYEAGTVSDDLIGNNRGVGGKANGRDQNTIGKDIESLVGDRLDSKGGRGLKLRSRNSEAQASRPKPGECAVGNACLHLHAMSLAAKTG